MSNNSNSSNSNNSRNNNSNKISSRTNSNNASSRPEQAGNGPSRDKIVCIFFTSFSEERARCGKNVNVERLQKYCIGLTRLPLELLVQVSKCR